MKILSHHLNVEHRHCGNCEHFTVRNIWYDANFLKQCLHTAGLIYLSKLKMLIKKERPAQTYMNATAKRIDHLFKKSGIVFWHFSVITSRAPRGCQRKCTEAVLLLLIKAVNQGSQYFFFFFFVSIFLSLDVFVSLRSKP